jgi:aminoglycoside/choline kinase family phosphotransferase
MLLADDGRGFGSDELGASARRSTELPFVNVARYLAGLGFAVPAIYHDAAQADGLLLLEDVGDTTLWAAASARPGDAPDLFAAAVDLLVALQVAAARRPDPDCGAFHRRFDGVLARAELEHFVEHGIETRLGQALPAPERTAILAGLDPLAAPFESPARVFSHRDYMAWNIHVQEGRLRLIDFQDALLAPEAFDLSQLLTDRTTSTLIDPEGEALLIERFRAGRQAAGLPVGDDFPTAYRQCALQHVCKVIGRFYFLERVKGKAGYLAYLPAVYVVGRRMFDALPDLAAVRARIVKHVPELASS